MTLFDVAKLRPLYLVAVTLCWNASFLTINMSRTATPTLASLLLLSGATLVLGAVTFCVRRTPWARGVVLRDESSCDEVRGLLFFITFLSLSLGVWGLLIAYEM